jgi:hypothetical protein
VWSLLYHRKHNHRKKIEMNPSIEWMILGSFSAKKIVESWIPAWFRPGGA